MTSTIRSTSRYQSVSRNGNHLMPPPRMVLTSDPDGRRSPMRSPSRPIYANPSLSRSFNELRTLNRNSYRPATAMDVAEVNPEIMSIDKNNAVYHVSVDLNANFLNPLKRPASTLPRGTLTKENAEQTYASLVRDDFYDSSRFQLGRTGSVGNNRSVHDLTTYRPTTLQSLATTQTFTATLPTQKTHSNLNSKAVINVDVAKNSSVRSTESRYTGLDGEDFVIKSIKPTESTATITQQVEDDVTLDLRLFGRAVVSGSVPSIESETVTMKSSGGKKAIAQRKSKRSIKTELPTYDEVDASSRSASRSKVRALDSEPRQLRVETVNVSTEVSKKQTMPKSCNTDPELVSAAVQTLSVRNSAAQTDPVYEDSTVVQRMNLRELLDDEPVVRVAPQSRSGRSYREVEEQISEPENYDSVMTTSGFIKRLTEGAPQGSLRQKMDVKKEDDEIVGPLPKEEIERMYSNSMINVDSVSEKVDLALSSGIAHLVVKIIYERIVPIRETPDTFKKSSVVVTRVIDVDLTVTEERKKIYEHIINNHKSGKLDNKYTFELYKAFIALAEADNGNGTNQDHTSIEKQVDEEKLWSLGGASSATGEESLSFKILENRFSDSNKQTSTSYRPSTISDMKTYDWENIAGSRHGASESNGVFETTVSGTNEFYTQNVGGNINAMYGDDVDSNNVEYTRTYRSAISGDDAGKRVISGPPPLYEASGHRTVLDDLFKKNAPSNWKHIYDKWNAEVAQENEQRGITTQGRMSSRINVHEYLRAGGNRTHNMAMGTFLDIKPLLELNGASLSDGNSLSDKILLNAGIEHGSHRHRMKSYTKSAQDVASKNTPISNKSDMLHT